MIINDIQSTFQNSFSSIQNVNSPKNKRMLSRKPELKVNKKTSFNVKSQIGLTEQLSFIAGPLTNDKLASTLFYAKSVNSNSTSNIYSYNKKQSQLQIEQTKHKIKKQSKIISFVSPRGSNLSDYNDVIKHPQKINSKFKKQLQVSEKKRIQNHQINSSELKKINSQLRQQIEVLKQQLNLFKIQLNEKQKIIENKSKKNEILQITKLCQRLKQQIKSANRKNVELEEKIQKLNNSICQLKLKLDQVNEQLLIYKNQLEIQKQNNYLDGVYIYQLKKQNKNLNLKLHTTQRKMHSYMVDQQGLNKLRNRSQTLEKMNNQLKNRVHRLLKSSRKYQQFELSPEK